MMIWSADLIDGTTVQEYKDGKEFNFKYLDKSLVDTFRIIDSGKDFTVSFSGDTGILKFRELDLNKLNELKNFEFIVRYDPRIQNFVIDRKALSTLNSLFVEESKRTFIQFDQTGKFNVNGEICYLGFEIDGKEIELINQPPYQDIIHYKEAVTDFIGYNNASSPTKRNDYVLNYAIGYNKVHVYDDLKFSLSCKLLYNTVKHTITMDTIMTINDNVQGNVVLHFGNKVSKMSIYAGKNQSISINRILCLV